MGALDQEPMLLVLQNFVQHFESGNITAGNASQISDGGSAIVVVSRTFAESHEVDPLAHLISYGQVAGPDTSLLTQPSRAINQSLDTAEMSLSDIDLFEINEAFAAVSAASMKDLGLSNDIVNVNGGAIAAGHPWHVQESFNFNSEHELQRRGGGIGAAFVVVAVKEMHFLLRCEIICI